jgi:hypothetical protein
MVFVVGSMTNSKPLRASIKRACFVTPRANQHDKVMYSVSNTVYNIDNIIYVVLLTE